MSHLSEKIINKIKEEAMSPAPKINFLAKDYLFKILAVLCLLIGSLATGVIIFIFANQEWDIYERVAPNLFNFIFLIIPYFWLLIFIIFIIITYYDYRQTKFGYRFRFLYLIISYLIITLIIGSLLYFLGLGGILEQAFNERLPHLNYEHYLWQRTGDGLLAGTILSLTATNIVLEDLEKNTWSIDYNPALLINNQTLSVGQKIKIIGDEKGFRSFWAEEIRPWCGCAGCLKSPSASCAGAAACHN
jgi:hypothetical protein